MGTRNLICVFYKGRFVVAQYTQWDGYIEGQGFKIHKFLLDPENIERLKAGLEHIYPPTEKELKEIDDECRKLDAEARAQGGDDFVFLMPENTAINKHWPSLSRDCGAKILNVIADATADKRVPIQLELEFANDGLFCEFAYVVDMDEETFEVYAGSETKAESPNKRFNDVGDDNNTVPALVGSFPFKQLPATEAAFMDALKQTNRGHLIFH